MKYLYLAVCSLIVLVGCSSATDTSGTPTIIAEQVISPQPSETAVETLPAPLIVTDVLQPTHTPLATDDPNRVILQAPSINTPVVNPAQPTDAVEVAEVAEVNNPPIAPPDTPNGRVAEGRTGLRLRTLPSENANVLTNLIELSNLYIYGRTGDSAWLAVRTENDASGWVMTQFVEVYGDLDSIALLEVDTSLLPEVAQNTDTSSSSSGGNVQAASQPVNASGTGQVVAEGNGLRLREQPSTNSRILANLDENTSVSIIGRTEDGSWLQISTTSGEGWVWGAYIQSSVNVSEVSVPAAAFEPTPSSFEPPTTRAAVGIISGVTSNSSQIFLRGQSLGNRAEVFSKVGDSITATGHFLYPFGWNTYNLGSYAYFQEVINFFNRTTARESNSFSNGSFAAKPYWTSQTVLDPSSADDACVDGEMPLVCEYRIVRPSISLIMIGTNDIGQFPAEQFQNNLQRIVEISMDMGVIPVLSTVPPKVGWEADVNVFNQIIIATAQGYDVPLWDYYTAMLSLPNQGLDGDGVHPSWLGDGYENYEPSGTFNDNNLTYGFPLRNLTALQVLDAVWRQVIAPNQSASVAVQGNNTQFIDPNLLTFDAEPAAPIENAAPVENTAPVENAAPAAIVNCTGAPLSRLTVSGIGRVTPGPANNLRDAPSLSAAQIGQIPGGREFTVLEGPVCADNMAFWRVDFDGRQGWTSEGKGNTYWLEPAN